MTNHDAGLRDALTALADEYATAGATSSFYGRTVTADLRAVLAAHPAPQTVDDAGGIDTAALRQVAEAVSDRPREWRWSGQYPQQIISQGNVVIIAECHESPDHPSRHAEYIATFDPVTILALLDEVGHLRTVFDLVASVEAKWSADSTLLAYTICSELGDAISGVDMRAAAPPVTVTDDAPTFTGRVVIPVTDAMVERALTGYFESAPEGCKGIEFVSDHIKERARPRFRAALTAALTEGD